MSKGRVLLAHVNTDCRKIYGSVLAYNDYEVEAVSDGESALRLLATSHFDLVITDLYLAGLKDECVPRTVRANAFSAHLPVVVITAWTTELHREVARDAGADAFLELPVRPRELVEVVAQLLQQPLTPLPPQYSPIETHDPVANGL